MITTNTISQQPASSKRDAHIKRIAIFQLTSGVLSLLLGLLNVILFSAYYFQVGAGIWGGLMTIAIGIVGYKTVKKNAGPSVGAAYTAYMVMNIICAVAITNAIFSTSSTAADSFSWIDCEHQWGPDFYWCRELGPYARASWGVNMLLSIILFTAFVASIIGSAFSCGCCEQSMNSGPRYATRHVAQQQPMEQVVDPMQYVHQQPQIVLPYQEQQKQPMILQNPYMQQQPMMILQQSTSQQPFFLHQAQKQQPQAQVQPLLPGEVNLSMVHENLFSEQIYENVPKKGDSDLLSYDSVCK